MSVVPLTFIFLALATVTNARSLQVSKEALPTVKERKLAFQKEFLDLLLKFEDILPEIRKEFDLPEGAILDSATVDIIEPLVEEDTNNGIHENQKISDDTKDASLRLKRCATCGCNPLPSGLKEDEAYSRLNFKKKGISETFAAFFNPTKAFKIRDLAHQSSADAKRLYKNSLHNGEGDAFRHALWMYRVTKAFGYDVAKTFGDAHERSYPNPVSERLMDLFNNEVGRCLGKDVANHAKNDTTVISNAIQIGILQTSRDLSYPTQGSGDGTAYG